MSKKAKTAIEEGSGNVFADLGFSNAGREQLKAHLTLQIYRLIKKRKLTQTAAGQILGIKQPHVSSLMRGQSGSFSVERLMEFLTALGQDVEITVKPTRRGHGEVSVVVR
ncbi:MAG: helix-turn-helix transcriptional regulator [Rhodospirillales bacterium]